jgi:hypothetical protein
MQHEFKKHKENLYGWLYAMQQRNLVYNYNFTLFSNQLITGGPIQFNHPDGWIYKDEGTNGSISKNTTMNSCVIVTSSESDKTMTFSQALHEFPRWKETLQGNTVTAKILLNVSSTCFITCELSDGVKICSQQIQVNGDIELDLTIDVSISATQLVISLKSSAPSVTINIRKIFANIGYFAIETLPCMVQGVIGERKQYIATEIAPVNELSLCASSAELPGYCTRLDSVLNGRFGMGKTRSLLPDVRGYFSRAWDNGAETDPDANSRTTPGSGSIKGDHVSTLQKDQFKSHDHELTFDISGKATLGQGSPATSVIQGNPLCTKIRGGSETRGINFAELYTIKWS